MFQPRLAAAPGVLDIPKYVPGRSVEQVAREAGRSDLIKLSSNENPFGMSPKAAAAIAAAIPRAAQYPEVAEPLLHDTLAAHCGVGPANIITGNGADSIIYLAALAFLQPRDEVIIPELTFDMYAIAARSKGALIATAGMPNLKIDVDRILSAVTERTRMLFLCNPNNPTGTLLSRNGLDRLIAALPDQVFVVYDEVYADFASAEGMPSLAAPAVAERCGALVVRSLAKSHGLAGVRFGYGIASEETVSILQRVRPPFDTSVLAQRAAGAALHDGQFLERTVANNEQGRETINAGLEALGMRAVPSAANFVLFDTGRDAAAVAAALEARGVIVRAPRAPQLAGYLRVSVGLPHEVRRFLDALADAAADDIGAADRVGVPDEFGA